MIECLEALCKKHSAFVGKDISIEDIINKKRGKQEISDVRIVFVSYLYNNCGLNVATISKKLHRDHTTILHAIEKVHEVYNYNPHLKNQMEEFVKDNDDEKRIAIARQIIEFVSHGKTHVKYNRLRLEKLFKTDGSRTKSVMTAKACFVHYLMTYYNMGTISVMQYLNMNFASVTGHILRYKKLEEKDKDYKIFMDTLKPKTDVENKESTS